MKNFIQTALVFIGIAALVCVIGSAGALERDMINCGQCLVQSALSILVMLGAFKLAGSLNKGE